MHLYSDKLATLTLVPITKLNVFLQCSTDAQPRWSALDIPVLGMGLPHLLMKGRDRLYKYAVYVSLWIETSSHGGLVKGEARSYPRRERESLLPLPSVRRFFNVSLTKPSSRPISM